ncbi:MAG: 50S ribosomal protein L6 [Coxiellaceae bacterium]|nr:50S ribosomal protein L6 [Coxiellaceae bacterium]
MSRVANNPVILPSDAQVSIKDGKIDIKGPKGQLSMAIHPKVKITHNENQLIFAVQNGESSNDTQYAGTMRAIANNMVIGVTAGFERKLLLEGTGYRAQAQGKDLHLTLGFSHPVVYKVPDGITVECPSQREIVVKGIDKQLVGQVSANIRAYRPPEPYKGKGVRYADEQIVRKEVKKK